MIRFACPACGAKVAAPEQLAGRLAPCKRCGEKIRVPAAPPATAIAARRKEPGAEALVPAAREIPAPEVLPLFKTPPPTRLLVVIGLLAATLVLGVIGAGVGCYYFMYLPHARKAAPLAPVAAAPATPIIPAAPPIQNPAAPTPPAVDADVAKKEAERQEAARKEAERQESMRKEAARLAVLQAEKERLEAEELAEEIAEVKRFSAAYALLAGFQQAMLDKIVDKLVDPNFEGSLTKQEYGFLHNHWNGFDTKKVRAGFLRMAWRGGFDKVSADIGFSPKDADLTDAAVEWTFLVQGGVNVQSVVDSYKQRGYDKMPRAGRQFMLDRPVLFRPILEANAGR